MENEEFDLYKKSFKLYKNWTRESDLPLIDLSDKNSRMKNEFFKLEEPSNLLNLNTTAVERCKTFGHFLPYDQWRLYRLNHGISGLLIIPGIIRDEFRSDWFEYFQQTLPRLHRELNLKANIKLSEEDNESRDINLRWITFGYHHDWDTKHYHLDQSEVRIPERIQELSLIASTYLNLMLKEECFKPEAGIVNYYTKGSSLCFHTDHSELNHKAPLFSLSLGQPAVFLIGGHRKDSCEPIVPLLLRDSDLVIMSGDSRLSLHAIPKILSDDDLNGEFKKSKNKDSKCKKQTLRINVNIRQVF